MDRQEDLIEKLLLMNCHKLCKIEEDGKCYNQFCLMGIDPEVREIIKKEGCLNFTRYKQQENVCTFETCCLTQEKNEPGPCKFAIINEAGDPDCGYG
jgi:hypothetical protein